MTAAPAAGQRWIGDPPPPIRRDRMVQAWAVAATISKVGDACLTIALAWTAVQLLPPGPAGIVLGVATIPQGLLMLVGGVLADRIDTRRILIAGALARVAILAVAISVWVTGHQSGLVLAAMGLSFGSVAGLTFPAGSTLLRQLVRTEDLQVGVGWVQLGGTLAFLAGAPLGGYIAASWGLVTAMIVDAATFAVITATLLFVIRPRIRLTRDTAEPWRKALAGTVTYLRRDRTARGLVIALFAPNIFLGPIETLGLPLRITQAGWPATWLGIAETTGAVATVAGCLIALRLRGTRPAIRAFQILTIQGVGIALIGVDSQPAVLTGMIAIGITSGAASVLLSTAFQRAIDGRYLGRVSSVAQIGDLLLLPAFTPAFGYLTTITSLVVAAAAFGAGMTALSLRCATLPSLATPSDEHVAGAQSTRPAGANSS